MLCYQGNTTLHWASYNGHGPVAAQLLDAKADPNLTNKGWGAPILALDFLTFVLSLFCGDVTS